MNVPVALNQVSLNSTFFFVSPSVCFVLKSNQTIRFKFLPGNSVVCRKMHCL